MCELNPTGAQSICPLCESKSLLFHRKAETRYYRCSLCRAIFMDPQQLPDAVSERGRYEEHNNDIEDHRYQKFVSPITAAILRDFQPTADGLDFGAGPGPVISHILQQQHYQIAQYDPYFHPQPHLLQQRYDYIACCEVIEHFYQPQQEFRLLRDLLQPGGKLYCMTVLYQDKIDFGNWFYLNDRTHVFFYSEQTLAWIAENMGFTSVDIAGRLITFSAN